MSKSIASAVCCSLLSSGLLAETWSERANSDDWLQMPIEELLSVRVDVASSRTQEIAEAPLIVSRFDKDDLVAMGITSLEDMLNFFPGILTQGTQSGNSAIMSRGLVDSFNQKVLFLLNNVPYWAPSHSAVPLNGVPFESISHVEIVRGPAAVYYGTNASAAVINVVTHQSSDNVVAVNYFEDAYKIGMMANYRDGNFWSNLSLEKTNDDGRSAQIIDITPSLGLPSSGEFLHSLDNEALLFRLGYKDFSAMYQQFEVTHNGHNSQVPFILTNGLKYQGRLLHLENGINLGNHTVNVFTDYNQFELRFPITNALVAVGASGNGGFKFENGDANYRWRSGTNVDSKLSEYWSLFYGLEYEHRQSSEYQLFSEATGQAIAPIMQAASSYERSLFMRSDYRYENWRFILGGRYVDNKDSGTHLAPEISTVYQLDQQQSLKLLYAEGFNSPNFVQKGIDLGAALRGNPNLEAEIINTLDLAYTYSSENTLFVINGYFIEADNLIQRDVSTGIIMFENTGDISRYGMELDYQVAFDRWKLFSNVGYVKQGNDSSEDASAAVAPKLLMAAGASYHITAAGTLGGHLNHVSRRAESGSYTDITLSYQHRIRQLTLSAGVHNLLDQDITASDVQNFSPTQRIVYTDGIYVNLGAKYTFSQ
ncbi:TonB-dependent receptor [Marinobacter sp. SS21]|uniref:TonB-dependent receptor n=1 Tax=Marinobacter sp. SS21 TaxID=2979460 RepID=UPI002331210C|nr:TonB-dependent receptor [Marinobacter sp. SS21]MDC0663659.1 TonB-dependent receptor [Marinobacter sp. SS21]